MRERSAGGEKIGGSMGRGRYEWGHGQVWCGGRGGCDGERGYLMRAVDGRQVGGEGGEGKKVARGVRGTPA